MTPITALNLDALFWKFVRERAAGSEILKHFPIRVRGFARSLGKTYGEYIVVDPHDDLTAVEGEKRRLLLDGLVTDVVGHHATRFVNKAKHAVAAAVTRDRYREAVAKRGGPTLHFDEDDYFMDDDGKCVRFLPEGGVTVFAPGGRCGEYQVRGVYVLAGTGRCVHPATGKVLGDSPEMRVYQEDIGRVVLNVMVPAGV